MAEIALGWLGWSEDELMEADINSILVGLRGKKAMLKACFGSSEEPEEGKSKSKPTPQEFKSFAATHNAVVRKR